MKSVVTQATTTWGYLKRVAKTEGVEAGDAEALRRMDRKPATLASFSSFALSFLALHIFFCVDCVELHNVCYNFVTYHERRFRTLEDHDSKIS